MTDFLFNLDAELLSARVYIERTEAMLAEITEEYFSIPGENNPHTPQGCSNVISGFEQNRIVAEIARDYATQTRQTLAAIADMIKQSTEKDADCETRNMNRDTHDVNAIALAGAALAQSGKMSEAIALLTKYGVQNISQLSVEQCRSLALDLASALAELDPPNNDIK